MAISGCQDDSHISHDDAVREPNGEGSVRIEELVEKPPSSGRFTRLDPATTGVDFVAPIDTTHPKRFLYHSGFMSGGVALGDFDGDGQPDVFLVGGPGSNRLYLQTAPWEFEDVTSQAGVAGGEAWGAGVAALDIDGDGDLDLYVCNYDSPNALYLNDGKGRFNEAAADFGLDVVDASLQPAVADYDRDGDLDIYLTTYRYYWPTGAPEEFRAPGAGLATVAKYDKYFQVVTNAAGKPAVRPVGRPDRLLRNNGDGSFTDVSERAGIVGKGFGLSATWWDYDGDGWPDLYVANDFNDPDRFYRNNRDGTFSDLVAEAVPHTTNTSMGADFGDLTGDGRQDLLVADMSATTHFMQKVTMGAMGATQAEMERLVPHQYMRNALYVNTGTGRFMEAAYLAGLADSDWTWAVKIADLDNDGRNDVLFTNGMTRSFNDSDFRAPPGALMRQSEFDAYISAPVRRERNLAYRNQGELSFEDVSKQWGLDHEGISAAAAYGDLDRDGDLDLVVMNLDEPVGLYRNDAASGHALLIRLVGGQDNRYGIGAQVELTTKQGKQTRQLFPTSGFQSTNEPLIHFGLGEATAVDGLRVRWPSGQVQHLEDLSADRLYRISQPEGTPPAPPRIPPEDAPPPLFQPSEHLAGIAHHEQAFDDFQRQPLLPWKHSQLGPAVAWGDADGDGDDDLFVGGARGQAGALYRNEGNQKFRATTPIPWIDDISAEDLGAVWLDVDADGDLDLYVASGGVECEPDDPLLQDRLYLNDAAGRFQKAAPDWLPAARDSSGPVAAADFDRDGDVDLFVGGRVIPGRYPLAPRSRLLRNEGRRFSDATDEVAPSLAQAGMATGAVWSDANGDGWLDLLVTYEWGPVRLWSNQQGRLVEQTEAAGLAGHTGWFNGIAPGDVDGDGDLDYVVTNFGRNTKYHASAEQPALLYYGDFDGSGRMQLVEAEHEDETLFPVRGKSCSTRAMPFLADKFPRFRDFASASLQEIYSAQKLSQAQRFAATTLDSIILVNDGQGHFEIRSLPPLAQIAPAFGVVVADLTGDGIADIALAQNFYSPQWETGRMDGGVSPLLMGRGDGSFEVQTPDRSGIVVAGDAKSLTLGDTNHEGRPDLIFGLNDAPLRLFEARAAASHGQHLAIRLVGPRGNPAAIGARLVLQAKDGTRQTCEIAGGSGYLSQSSPEVYFGLGKQPQGGMLHVTWPDGSHTRHEIAADQRRLIVRQ